MAPAPAVTTWEGVLLLLAPGLPVAWALLAAARRGGAFLRMSPWSTLPAFLAALLVPAGTFVELPWAMLQARVGLDDTGRVFLLFTSLLWLTSTVDACSSMTKKPRQRAFFFFTLLSMSGNFGLILAQDLFSFYLWFALMSFSSYGLVVHYRTEESIYAGRIYIIMVVLGEILIFTAFVLIYRTAGSPVLSAQPGMVPETWTIALILAGFGIKAGAIPLHVWLPLAHPAAPTPASAVLSGAMIKAGLLGWLRFLPIGASSSPEWGAVLVGGGLLGAFGGVGMGLAQHNLKTILAYSSISQMGLMTVGVGLAMLIPERSSQVLAAVTVYACHHGLTKGALFLGVGIAGSAPRHSRRRLWVLAAMGFCGAALAGFPLTGGFLAKGLLKEAVGTAPSPWNLWLNDLLPLTAWGTALLMVHFLALLARSAGSGGVGMARWISWHAILVCVVMVAWMLPEGAHWRAQAFDPAQWLVALWPAALAVLTALLFTAFRRLTGKPLTASVPPGDILAATRVFRQPLERMRSATRSVESVLDRGFSLYLFDAWAGRYGRLTDLIGRLKLRELEQGLLRFRLAGTLLILIMVTLFLLLWEAVRGH